jgi:hypothetical protein
VLGVDSRNNIAHVTWEHTGKSHWEENSGAHVRTRAAPETERQPIYSPSLHQWFISVRHRHARKKKPNLFYVRLKSPGTQASFFNLPHERMTWHVVGVIVATSDPLLFILNQSLICFAVVDAKEVRNETRSDSIDKVRPTTYPVTPYPVTPPKKRRIRSKHMAVDDRHL